MTIIVYADYVSLGWNKTIDAYITPDTVLKLESPVTKAVHHII